MHGDAVRAHQPRHAHFAVGRVGDDTEGIGTGPPLDERIALGAFHRGGHVPLDAGAARAHPQRLEPGGEGLRIQVPGSGQRGQRFAGGHLGQPGRGLQAGARLGEERAARLIHAVDQRPHPGQRHVGATRDDQPWIRPQREVRLGAVPGIGGDQEGAHLARGVGRRELETHLAGGGQRRDRHLPGARTVALADVAHGGEAPDGPLPRLHHARHGGPLARLGLAPTGPDLVQERRRRLGLVQLGPQPAEVAGVELARAGQRLHLGLRLARLARGRGPQLEGGVEILGQWQDAAIAGVELDALEVDRRAPAIAGVAAIERADGAETFLGPVALRGAGREAQPVGKEDRMAGHLLGGIEVLGDQRRRHHQRLAHVHEALARGRIDGELPGRVERLHAGQVAERVGVLGVGEPAQHHRSWVARVQPRPPVEQGPHARHQLLPGFVVHGRPILRRHFAQRHLLEHLLPDLGVGRPGGGSDEALEVEVALVLLGGMALQAMRIEERAGLGIEPLGRRGREP